MFCKNCGKEINDNAVVCPECGVATDKLQQQTAPAAAPTKTNGWAIAGLVLVIIGCVGGNYGFCIPSFLGLIFSIVGIVKAKTYNSGKGMAIAGTVIGAIGFIVWLFIWIFAIGIVMSSLGV